MKCTFYKLNTQKIKEKFIKFILFSRFIHFIKYFILKFSKHVYIKINLNLCVLNKYYLLTVNYSSIVQAAKFTTGKQIGNT